MSISIEASAFLEQHFDELHERYQESKVELANVFTYSEALLILCLCCNLISTPSMFDQSILTDIYIDHIDSIESIDSHNVHLALRKLRKKWKQLNAFQTYAVLVMASECLSVPENNIIEPRLLLELRVKYVFGIEDSTSA
ncbi:hypothetical protein [Alicyclobacillus mengziensis]|uniref:Uncharacterized protein n=1 Tax=Alicyclobacillus mengziensis TaxID=2931921 RepID=A0A9X7W0W8_9BACL|nr:hypothetical protein [Alicyclobacillus mengziensis]QSO48412.1 hypothetical protein JZ786_05335 [Alicyclobacillus mengziensis]